MRPAARGRRLGPTAHSSAKTPQTWSAPSDRSAPAPGTGPARGSAAARGVHAPRPGTGRRSAGRAQAPRPAAAESRTTTAAESGSRALRPSTGHSLRIPSSCTWRGMPEPIASPAEHCPQIGDHARALLRWLAPQLSPHLARLWTEPTGFCGLSALETQRANGGMGYLLRVTVLVEAQPLPPQGQPVLSFGGAGLVPCGLDPERPAESRPGRERSVIQWAIQKLRSGRISSSRARARHTCFRPAAGRPLRPYRGGRFEFGARDKPRPGAGGAGSQTRDHSGMEGPRSRCAGANDCHETRGL